MTERLANPSSQFPDSPPDSGSEPYSPPNSKPVHPKQPGSNAKSDLMDGNTGGASYAYLSQHGSINSNPQLQMNVPNPSGMLSSGGQYHQHQQMSADLHPVNMFNLPRHNFSYVGLEPPKLNHLVPQILNQTNSVMSGFSTDGAHLSKKRKYSDSPPGTLASGLVPGLNLAGIFPVKPEPCPPDLHHGILPDCSEDDSYSYDFGAESGMFLDGTYQVIKWTAHQMNKWVTLLDEALNEISSINYRVDADKGFNFALPDDAFVCQKKNHFQITVHVSIPGNARYVRQPVEENISRIDSFYLHFYGIKMESQSQMIKVEQSQSDRSKKQFHPVRIEIPADQVTKVTVGRLHFSETTSNNMRKKGKPNPDQRYFQLVVALQAHCGEDVHMIAAHASERIIVRASNPGQFESDVEAAWSRGKTSESIYHAGRVGINTDNPDESLAVHGNIRLTGHVISPSDIRAKKNVIELDTKEQLKNISQLKVYHYSYNEEFAEFAGLSEDELNDTGVIAQDVGRILPDAVRETGDIVLPSGERIDNFLVVNKERIFIENVGAVKELCKVTDKLENRISEIEIVNKKLAKLSALRGSFKSVCSSISLSACSIGKWDSRSGRSDSKSSSSQGTAKVTASSKRQYHPCHQQQRNCCGANSQQTTQTTANQSCVCNNRTIQITIIALVLIMALCLMSITVLYIVDRQSYPSSESSHVFVLAHATDNWTQATTVAKDSSVSGGGLTPSGRPEPLLPPECLLNPQYCNVQCCSNIPSPPPQYDPDHGISSPVVVASSSRPPKRAEKSSKSPNDVKYQLDRQPKKSQMDFGAQSQRPDHTMDPILGGKTRTSSSVLKFRPRTAVYFTASATSSLVSTAFTTLSSTEVTSPGSYHIDSGSVVEKESSDYLELNNTLPEVRTDDNEDVVHIPRETLVNGNARHNDLLNDIRYGRMDDYSPNANMNDEVVRLYFKQLNSTISTSYCTNDNCRQQRGGNYTYAVPLSAKFPQLYITILFKQLVSDLTIGISLCSEKENQFCSQVESDSTIGARKAGNFEWDLPIGYYLSSYFRFRVFAMSQAQEQLDVCQQSSSSAGISYSEYILTFYHVCS